MACQFLVTRGLILSVAVCYWELPVATNFDSHSDFSSQCHLWKQELEEELSDCSISSGKKRVLLKIENSKIPFILTLKIPFSQKQTILVHFLVFFS